MPQHSSGMESNKEYKATSKGPEATDDVPGIVLVRQSVFYKVLQPHLVSSPRLLCHTNYVTAAAVDVRTKSGSVGTYVIKVVPAERVSTDGCQLDAEQLAAEVLPVDPRLAKVIAIASDEEGNVSTLTPYAGITLEDMLKLPGWLVMPFPDKLQVFKLAMACMLQVHVIFLKAPGGPWVNRDIKPNNIVVGKKFFACIDFGLLCRELDKDCHGGFSPQFLTPEMAELTNGQPLIYKLNHLRQAVTSRHTDTFLLGLCGYIILFGMPLELDIGVCKYNIDVDEELVVYLDQVHSFDWANSEGMRSLRHMGYADEADFLTAMLRRDPKLRATPDQALQHPCLAGVAEEVNSAVANAMPGYVYGNQEILSLLEGLRDNENVFMVSMDPEPCHSSCYEVLQQQQPCSSNSSSSSREGPLTPCICNTRCSQTSPESPSVCSGGSSSNASGEDSSSSSSSSSSEPCGQPEVQSLTYFAPEAAGQQLQQQQLAAGPRLQAAVARDMQLPQHCSTQAGPATPCGHSTYCSLPGCESCSSSSEGSLLSSSGSSSSNVISQPEVDLSVCMQHAVKVSAFEQLAGQPGSSEQLLPEPQPSAAPKRGLLQRAFNKLVKRLSPRNTKVSKAAASQLLSSTVSTAGRDRAAEGGDGSDGSFVPGLCGLLHFSRSKRHSR